MADKKIDRALYGPSTWEVAFGAALGLFVGVLAACLYLTFKPVQTVKDLPKDPVLGMVYFQPGKVDATKGSGWIAKQRALYAGGTALFTEEELNAWAAAMNSAPTGTPAAKPAAKTPPAPAAKSAGNTAGATAAAANSLSAGTPNFRIVGTQLQVGVKCTLSYYGFVAEVPVVTVGVFAHEGGGVVFHPEKFYLGSCPVHRLPGATGWLMKRLAAVHKTPEELQAAWHHVTDAGVEQGRLKLSTGS